jgi:CDP-paratose 2-epimerase
MQNILVTGGSGFIGSNLALALSQRNVAVTILDNFSRHGSLHNLEWLKAANPKLVAVKGDIRDSRALKEAAKGKDVIFHTAAQVAVTSSIASPQEDFEINALGTLNVLEAARENDSSVIYCSTNKVYGSNVNSVPLSERPKRYEFSGKYQEGIREDFPIDATEHTPYGVSKLAGDQYVRDYANVYGLHTVVNRMSCIYGTQQFGTADQGWISHFIRSAISGKPLTVYGDGKQVRDVLFVSDLVELFIKEAEADYLRGEVFNVGGGRVNSLSLLELVEMLEALSGNKIGYSKGDWRPADQKVYYSDISKANILMKWQPKITKEEGVKKLFEWTLANKSLLG